MINNQFQLYPVILVVFLGCAGVSFPYPILAPLFLADTPNVLNSFLGIQAELLLGAVIAAYPLGMIIGSSVLGAWSDRIGRKRLLSLSLIFTVIGYAASALALYYGNYLLFLATRFCVGLCEGNVSVARAIATDLAGDADKSIMLSKINAAVYSGLLAGPIIGGSLGELAVEFAFVLAMLIYIFCWLIVLFWVQETKQNTLNSAQKKSKLALSKILSNKRYLSLLVVQLVMAVGTTGAYHFIPVWLTSVHELGPKDIGFNAAVMSAFMILTSLYLVKTLTQMMSKEAIYIVFASLLASLYGLMVFLPVNLSLYAFMLTGIPIALLSGTFPAYVVECLGQERSGLLLGSLSSMTSIASVIVAIIGSLSLTLSHSAPILISAVFCGLSACLFLCVILFKDDTYLSELNK